MTKHEVSKKFTQGYLDAFADEILGIKKNYRRNECQDYEDGYTCGGMVCRGQCESALANNDPFFKVEV